MHHIRSAIGELLFWLGFGLFWFAAGLIGVCLVWLVEDRKRGRP
jgi:hypothetical protein